MRIDMDKQEVTVTIASGLSVSDARAQFNFLKKRLQPVSSGSDHFQTASGSIFRIIDDGSHEAQG